MPSLRERLRASGLVRALLPREELALSIERLIQEYIRGNFATMCPAEVVRDFFLSWARAKPVSPMVAGEQHDAVEALMHIVEECGIMGDCLRTGHAAHPDGVILSPLPEGFSARHSCSVQELVQMALLDDNALEHCPEVLCIAFSNMYEEADADWWVDLKLAGTDDVRDLSPCSRQCTVSL